ncbi:MAG: hypothetical protein Q8934_15590 [Bacillota bacterium]|nr:hypothetical protein [Bacillota bacterium]
MKFDLKLVSKIFELKGMIDSMTDLVSYDDQYNNPMIDRVEEKMNELIQLLENGMESIA